MKARSQPARTLQRICLQGHFLERRRAPGSPCPVCGEERSRLTYRQNDWQSGLAALMAPLRRRSA